MATLDRGSIRGRDNQSHVPVLGGRAGTFGLYKWRNQKMKKSCIILNKAATRALGSAYVWIAWPKDRVCCMRVRMYGWRMKQKQKWWQKNKEKKTHKERKNYNATSTNDISQYSKDPRRALTERTLDGNNGEKEELIHIHHGWGRVERRLHQWKLRAENSIILYVMFLFVLFFFSFTLIAIFFLCLQMEHKHKPAALDGMLQKAFKKDYGQQINESVN